MEFDDDNHSFIYEDDDLVDFDFDLIDNSKVEERPKGGEQGPTARVNTTVGSVTNGPPRQEFIKHEEEEHSREVAEQLRERMHISERETLLERNTILEQRLQHQRRQEAEIRETQGILKKKRARTAVVEPASAVASQRQQQQQQQSAFENDTQSGFRVLPPSVKRKSKRRSESPFPPSSTTGSTFSLSSQLHSKLKLDSQFTSYDGSEDRIAENVRREPDISISGSAEDCKPDTSIRPLDTRRRSTSMSVDREPARKILKVAAENTLSATAAASEEAPFDIASPSPTFIGAASGSVAASPFIPRMSSSSEAYRIVLETILQDIFLEWNRTQQNSMMDYKMALTAENLKAFSEEYAAYFKKVPSNVTLTKIHQQRLDIISSEILYYVSGQVQDANVIVRSLIIQFGYCLPVCLQYKLYAMLEHIALTLNRITITKESLMLTDFPYQQYQYPLTAIQQLLNELNNNRSQAVLFRLIECLSLFTYKYNNDRKPIPLEQQILMDKYPQLVKDDVTVNELLAIKNRHRTSISVIEAAIQALLTPREASSTTTINCILQILQRVGMQCSDRPILLFMLTDDNFLRLLSEETPIEVLFSCLAVIETMLRGDKDWTAVEGDSLFEKERILQRAMKEVREDTELKRAKLVPEVILRLVTLLHLPQGTYTAENWYKLRRRICAILRNMCLVKLGPQFLQQYKKYIFFKTMNLMKDCCKVDLKNQPQDVNKQHQLLVKGGFRVIDVILDNDRPSELFKEDPDHTVYTCRDLVIYYLEKIGTNKHPAKKTLESVFKTLDDEKEADEKKKAQELERKKAKADVIEISSA